jgi:hypothetical protein
MENIKNRIQILRFSRFILRSFTYSILYICIYISTIGCTLSKLEGVKIKLADVVISLEKTSKLPIEPITVVEDVISIFPTIEEKVLDYSDRIVEICDSLDGNIEEESNFGKSINEILDFTKVPRRSAYCGAVVKYVLSKAGIEYKVKNPEWASNNFVDKSQVIYQNGKWLQEEEILKVGYITGYRLGKTNRINHVGIFINEDNEFFYVFEGNTTNPKNSKQQGLYYKFRKKYITHIRKTY